MFRNATPRWPSLLTGTGALLLWAGASAAAVGDRIHRMPVDGQLSQNTVVDIVQDQRGLMWFGTLGGLNVYDGYSFRRISSDPRDPNALAGVDVARLMVDRDGAIWVAGIIDSSGWLDRYDPVSGRVDHLPSGLFGSPNLPGSATVGLYQDGDGIVWIGTNAGLHRHDPVSGETRLHVDRQLADEPLGGVTDIGPSPDGLWLATTTGLYRYQPDRARIEKLPLWPTPVSLFRLLVANNGDLWLGSSRGLLRRDAATGTITRYAPDDEFGPGGEAIRDLFEGADGSVWIAMHDGGLSRFREGQFTNYQANTQDPGSLASNDIWSVYEDRSGLLWIGTAGSGLNQINPSRNRFGALRSQPYNRDSLSHGFVWAIQQHPDGDIWMTTLHGLERYRPATGRFTRFVPGHRGPAPADRTHAMQALSIDDAGRIWVGSVDGALFRFDPARERFDWQTRHGADGEPLSRGRVWYLGPADDRGLWIATALGVFRLDTEASEPAPVPVILPSDLITMGLTGVRTSLIDSDGVQWFGGGGAGLIRRDPVSGEITVMGHLPNLPGSLSNNLVRAIHEGPGGDLWIGTHNGLNHLSAEDRRLQNNRFRLYTEADGLPNNTIYGILPEGDGRHLWLSTNAGLSRMDTSTETFRNYTVADGLSANELNGGAELRADDGRLYFGSVNGVTVFDPATLPYNDYVPPVRFTRVRRHDADTRELHGQVIGTGGALDFAHDEMAVTIEFAAMDFHQPERNRFRYRLLGPGAGGEWLELDQPRVSLAMLPPGHFALEVMASNSDGIWSSEPAVLPIRVHPPWWQTPLAWLVYLAAAALLVFGYHLSHRRKLARERRFNEMLVQKESLAEANHQLALHYAHVDQLTQLPNRTSLLDEIAGTIRRSRGSRRRFALLLLNIDQFKKVNDRLGHALGDRILQTTAERLSAALDEHTFLARVSSDEFAVIVTPSRAPERTVQQIGEELLRVLGAPHEIGEPPIVLGASIGVAHYEDSATTPTDLLGRADLALQHAKQNLPGTLMVYDAGMQSAAREKLSIEARIGSALENDEFSAYYQPLIDVRSGELAGFEALIRWFPQDGQPIFPDRFIPIAEDSGQIVELGRWMLNEVCRQAAEWQGLGLHGLRVAVNVSMRQLRAGTLIDDLRDALRRHEIPSSTLKLEITESAMMENVGDTAEQLAEIRALGVQLSIDDFGTGFSSLGHLKQLPVDELKIDRSFIGDLSQSAQSRKIVASIIRLAHELNIDAVGEGVEDENSLAMLRALGCDLVQGFHFARPMPAAELVASGWLSRRGPDPSRAASA